MKRKRDGQRSNGKGEGNSSGKKWKGQQQKGQLQGQGILLTTVRRRERKAGLELIEYLEDLVLELYPDVDFSAPLGRASHSDGEGGNNEDDGDEVDDDDDDLDALRNGKPSSSSSDKPQTRVAEAVDAPPSKANEDDIEAQIRAELQDMQSHGKRRKKQEDDAKPESAGRPRRQRERFKLVDLDVECLIFVTVAWPMDPVRLSCALLDQVAKTGQTRGKFVQRLSPVYETHRAETDKVAALAHSVMAKYFPKSDQSQTFKVDPRLRLHNTLSKMDIIQAVSRAVPSPHRADLTSPDYIINVEVLKSSVGIGILPRYEDYKRFNPHMIAQHYHKTRDGVEDGPASRSLQ